MRLARIAAFAALVLSVSSCSGGGSVSLDNDDQKTWYMAGYLMGGKQAQMLGFNEEQIKYAKEGFADAASGKEARVELPTFGPKVQALMRAKQEEAQKKAVAEAAARAESDKPFRDTAEKEEGASKSASGMIFRTLSEGKGALPKPSDWVSVLYTGKTSDGAVFDSTEKRNNQPLKTMVSGGIIPCWTEALQKMKVGSKARVTCPAEIAYGPRGRGPAIPGGATLQFEMELVSIDEAPKAPAGMSLPIHMSPGGAPAPTIKAAAASPAPTIKAAVASPAASPSK